MTQDNTAPAISEFAAKVRAALADLNPQEVQDLTDGLEADLAERAEDQGLNFGSAAAYADELRMAAGLPAVSGATNTAIDDSKAVKSKRQPLSHALEAWWAGRLAGSPVLAKTLGWLGKFRGFWWILRGYSVYLVFTNGAGVRNGLLPQSKLQALAAAFCIACSVVLGMKFWRHNWFLRLVNFGGQVVTVFAVIGTVFGSYSWQDSYWMQANESPIPTLGLYLNGREITNIFAYDADGKRLPLVQLFDQNGEPMGVPALNVNSSGLSYLNTLDNLGNNINLTTGAYKGKAQAWNVFPLLQTTDWPDSATDHFPTTPVADPLTAVPKLTVTTPKLLPDPAAITSASPSASPSTNGTATPTNKDTQKPTSSPKPTK